jgi:prophage regulatory protein
MTTLLRLPAVLQRTGLSRSMLYELLDRGDFPRPIKLTGGRINCWSDQEIAEWIDARLSERVAA